MRDAIEVDVRSAAVQVEDERLRVVRQDPAARGAREVAGEFAMGAAGERERADLVRLVDVRRVEARPDNSCRLAVLCSRIPSRPDCCLCVRIDSTTHHDTHNRKVRPVGYGRGWPDSGAVPSRRASVAAAYRSAAPSLGRMLAMCTLAVVGLMNSVAPISVLVRPQGVGKVGSHGG